MARSVNVHVSSSMYCQGCGAANPPHATHCFACGERLATAAGGTGTTTNPLTGLLLPAVIMQQRYRILEVLSTGEVSTLYKAEDIQLGNRLVNLREIGQDNSDTQEALEAIEAVKREMLLLAGLIHPNLPRIYDYFVENQRWYFVMDFLEGETLEAYLEKRKNRPLPVEEVLDSGIQLATMLDFLHTHQSPLGLKDLTLRNIWRTPDGKLYLLDTGTAPQVTAMPQSRSVYSLGRILRQLQAGKKLDLLHLALPGPRKRSRHAQSSLLKKLIRRMVHRDARKRPYTMGMVRQELQQQELQLLARQQPPTSTPKQRRFSRRTLLKMGGLAAASGALAWLVESIDIISGQEPNPGYSPKLGGTICTYDTGSGVLAVAWSPNGMRLAMGNWKGHVQAFDANTGLDVIDFQAPDLQQRVEDVIWLPGGNAIAAGGDDAIVWVWNAATGQLQRTYRGHTNWVITLASSPDGKYIASGSMDSTVQVWELATGRQVVSYRGHSGTVTSVMWSPDGKYIVSGSYDMTVQIWEAATGRLIFTYSGYKNEVYTVAWSPDGKYIASGGMDHTVQVWPVALFESDGQLQKSSIITYRGHSASVQTVAWSPDSRYVASAADNVQLWNGLTGKHIFTYTKHATSITSAVQADAWSPNGKYIASGGMEGTVQVWNAS
jgi:ribosomal protein L40E/tRNA A-37 threonylcarbamoyl transferase component Bud32